jgi:uncharacterized membrane protein
MAEAERVARDLEELGIGKEDISVVAGNDTGRHDEYVKKSTSTGAAAASAASFGGGVGIVAGLIALAIPGVGPIIAGGALATVLTGLGVGAAAGGLTGAFLNMGVSHEEAPLYEEAVRRGGVVVAVHASDPMENEVIRVMDEHGARDLNAEADAWRAAGWNASYSNPHPYPFDSTQTTHTRPETVDLDTSTDQVREVPPTPARRTNVRTYAYNPPPASGEPYQRPVVPGGSSTSESYGTGAGSTSTGTAWPNPTGAGQTTSTQNTSTQTMSEPTRTNQNTAQNTPGATSGEGGSNQFPVRRGPVHISDDDPAYVFGNRWASDPNYNGRSWTDVESSLRSNWEAMGHGPWDTFRDRVRRGYESGSEDPNAPTPSADKPGQRGF